MNKANTIRMLQRALLVSLFGAALCTTPATAQFSYRDTIGNETENNQKYMFAGNEARFLRTSIISNPNLRQFNSLSGFPSRHSRNEGSGIGGSTLQTTSVTSESAPALQRPGSLSIGAPIISRPDLSVRFLPAGASPALSGISIRSVGTQDETSDFRRPETFTTTRSQVPNVFSRSSSDELQFGE